MLHTPLLVHVRKTIGGTQDPIDEALLVEPGEDASLDLPPVLVTEQELDSNVQAFLDWRVGVEISKQKQRGALAR